MTFRPICFDHPSLSSSFRHFSIGDPQQIRDVEEKQFSGMRKRGDLMKFLQDWLFWGLLDHILQTDFRASDYLTDYQGKKNARITTRRLIQQLQQWQSRLRNMPRNKQWQIWYHMIDYLIQMRKVLEAIQASKMAHDVDDAVVFQIASVAECVAAAAHQVMNKRVDIDGRFKYEHHLTSSMANRGWCLSNATTANNQLNHCASRIYLSMISRPQDNFGGQASAELGPSNTLLRHGNCSRADCTEWKVNSATYKTKHRADCSGCTQVTVDESSLTRILEESDGFPVLNLERAIGLGSRLQITPQAYSTEIPFIAISHVWADGLGNKEGNALPMCQVQHLHDLIQKLKGAELYDGRQSADFALWIDTLCVPIHNRGAKALALNRMRRVYQDAEYVLIRDSTLESFSTSRGLVECTFRWVISPWNGRVWTLQEGTLPKRALVQFQDRAIDVRSMQRSCEVLGRHDLRYRSICWDLVRCCQRNRRPFHSQDSGLDAENVTNIMHSICHRRVDRPEDEALCIAFMLDVDVTDLTCKTTSHERMAELWRAIARSKHQRIPASVIYTNSPRLSEEGFRWAPASFLLRTDRRPEVAEEERVRDRLMATLTATGLAISANGVRLATTRASSPCLNMILTSADFVPGQNTESLFFCEEPGETRWLRRFFRFAGKDALPSVPLGELLKGHPIDKLVILDGAGVYHKVKRLGGLTGVLRMALIGRIIGSDYDNDHGIRHRVGGLTPHVETLTLGYTVRVESEDAAGVGVFDISENYGNSRDRRTLIML